MGLENKNGCEMNNPDNRARLASFFSNIKSEPVLNWKERTNNHILIVDGTNLFIRGWCSASTLNNSGDHMGGVVSSLKSLGAAIKLLSPSRVVCVFDGVGGSFKRKQLFPGYKEHRAGKIRLNRAYEEMSDPKTEEESRTKQYLRFVSYLQAFPVNIMSFDHIEADDLIAYLAIDYFKSSKKVTIFSSDRDFLQLCDSRVNVYSATKKRIYGVNEIIEEYNIHPNNFVLFRAIDGDKGDSIPGIERAGNKTIVKHFPWLKEETLHTIDEVVNHAIDLRNKFIVCENIASNKSVIERNYALMQLKETALTTICQLRCNEILEESKIPKLNKNTFFSMVREDMISNSFFNHVEWAEQVFGILDNVIRTE